MSAARRRPLAVVATVMVTFVLVLVAARWLSTLWLHDDLANELLIATAAATAAAALVTALALTGSDGDANPKPPLNETPEPQAMGPIISQNANNVSIRGDGNAPINQITFGGPGRRQPPDLDEDRWDIHG
jgi:hypothetical protein